MKCFKIKFYIFLMLLLVVFAFNVSASSINGTIDSTYKYAWNENTGWINFGADNGNVHITDSALSGSALSETIGWINLDNVVNDGEGNLTGYGWNENTGWINFAPANGGVVINSSGEFTGSALSETVGWVIFDGDYTVKTDWRPQSTRYVPSSSGLPMSTYNAPSPSVNENEDNFSVLINNGDNHTNNKIIELKLNSGLDTKKMAISNLADFSETGQENYQMSKIWSLSDGDGIKIVYVKFYTQFGQPSPIVSDTIILDTSIKITNPAETTELSVADVFSEKIVIIIAEAKKVTTDSSETLASGVGMSRNSVVEQMAAATYVAPLVTGTIGITAQSQVVMTNFIAYGTPTTKVLGAGERAGVVNSFKTAYNKLPVSEIDWQDIIKIANGRFPMQQSISKEQVALKTFIKIYKRLPDFSNIHDEAALKIMTYRLRSTNRNIDSEKFAIKVFKGVFGNNPRDASDWDIMRAIAYSGAKR